jgi:hypothetical protein
MPSDLRVVKTPGLVGRRSSARKCGGADFSLRGAPEGLAKIAAVSGNKFSKNCFEGAAIPNTMSLAK